MTPAQTLAEWYIQHKRELPWRITISPYKIWLSEIILQQTRVNQGINYYLNFIEAFPEVKNLADASPDEVLKLWQGLGYYSRARNLHETAKRVADEFNGEFPDTFNELLQLKGVGAYTAAAIASICYNEPVAVVDGNVYRFLSRYYGIDSPVDTTAGKKVFQKLAASILDRKNPGNHNQAIMEFGALQCTPVNPKCGICPLTDNCKAFLDNNIRKLPVKKAKINGRTRYFNYLVIHFEDNIFLRQRTGNDIWKMLYEFPVIETEYPQTEAEIIQSHGWKEFFDDGYRYNIVNISKTYKHILSHQTIYGRFFRIETENPSEFLTVNYMAADFSDIDKYAIPKLIERYLVECKNFIIHNVI